MEIKKYPLIPNPRDVDGFNKNDKVYLSIQIGNGQIGGSKVLLDGNQIAKGNLTQPTFLGESLQLSGKEIEIETNVLDVNNFTNMCVITTTLLNQNNQELFTKIDSGLAPDNGIASFKGIYKFSSLLVVVFFLLCPVSIQF